MADDCDLTEERMEREIAAVIGAASTRAAQPLPETGECHWCGDHVSSGLRFCDADCRDDYDRWGSR